MAAHCPGTCHAQFTLAVLLCQQHWAGWMQELAPWSPHWWPTNITSLLYGWQAIFMDTVDITRKGCANISGRGYTGTVLPDGLRKWLSLHWCWGTLSQSEQDWSVKETRQTERCTSVISPIASVYICYLSQSKTDTVWRTHWVNEQMTVLWREELYVSKQSNQTELFFLTEKSKCRQFDMTNTKEEDTCKVLRKLSNLPYVH